MSAIDLTGESARTYQYEILSRRFRSDDADRRALGVSAHDAERAGGDADVDAAGDHRLHRLAAAAGEQQLEIEVVLAENAGALAQRGRSPVPYFALPDRNLELVRGESRDGCEPSRDGGGETNPNSMDHGGPSLRSRHLRRGKTYARGAGRESGPSASASLWKSRGQAGASGRNFKATPLMQ